MQKVVTPAQMKKIDTYMIEEMQIPSVILMENAATHITFHVMQQCTPEDLVLIVCGTGNNGGDGFAAARQLMTYGFEVRIALLGTPDMLTEDSYTNYRFFENTDLCTFIKTEGDLDRFFEEYYFAAVIIDAIFGTGLKREVTGLYRHAVACINASYAKVISVDIPSGVDGLTGQVLGIAVKADETVTFQYPKVGHFIYPGADYKGVLSVHAIGVDTGCEALGETDCLVCENEDKDIFVEKRARNTNKGDYGQAAIIGGSYGMAGAAMLSAGAALASGAGKTRVISCGFVVEKVQGRMPEVMANRVGNEYEWIAAPEEAVAYAESASCAIVGPGLGTNEMTAKTVYALLKTNVSKVIDADGLNILAKNISCLEEATGEIVITPHPGEMARLTRTSVEEILANPIKAAAEFAEENGLTVVLKGASTVVASSRGEIVIVPQGSPGMAKGGSGDVLSGIIGALIAQGFDEFDAAVAGTYINGLAGEDAASRKGEYAMTPSDTIESIGSIINKMLHTHTKHCHH